MMMLDTITPIIWDPDSDAIVVRKRDLGPALPTLAVCDAGFGASLPRVIWDALGLTTIILENLDRAVFVVELQESPPLNVPGYEWAPVMATGLQPQDNQWVLRWLAHREKPIRPWFEHGWMNRALTYIDAVLADLGRIRIGHISQIKHWALSSVIRVETTTGPVFFKAAPPEAAIEPHLLIRLAPRWPKSVPALLAHSPQDNWWITDNFGPREGPTLTLEERLAGVELLARIQIAVAKDPSLLSGLPIERFSLEHLAMSIPQLLARQDRWGAEPADHEHWWPLDSEQREFWLSLGPTLIECSQGVAESMSELGISLSLIHGDFHLGNVAARDGGPILHDWANAQITHPFFDLAMLLKTGDEAFARAYLTTYFGPWHQAGWGIDTLRSHWECAKPISALFEISRALRLCDELGEAHQFSMIEVLYGWVRRLLGSVVDTSSTTSSWPASGIASKR